jgi:hypothetical protein
VRVFPEKKTIELSRYNIEVLLAKLDGNPPNSACTIGKDDWWVKAVEDHEHYTENPPGEMHPDTVNALAKETK